MAAGLIKKTGMPLLLSLVLGCANTQPIGVGAELTEAPRLRIANKGTITGSWRKHSPLIRAEVVFPLRVDGGVLPSDGLEEPIPIDVGERGISIGYFRPGFPSIYRRADLVIDVKPGREYIARFEQRTDSDEFVFWIEDRETGNIVSEKEVGYVPRPKETFIYTPIIIPRGR